MSDLLRILTKSGARPAVTFLIDGTPVDLDTGVPAVVATRPDGTVLSPALTATHVSPPLSNVGKYEVTYPPQPEVTLTRLDWTGTVGGVQLTLTTWVEAVGAHLFTLADLRAVRTSNGTPFTDTALYPESLLLQVRDEVTDDFEAICGWSFIPRHTREVYDSWPAWGLLLRRPRATRPISATVAGTAQDSTALAIEPGGVLVRKTLQPLWYGAYGRQNVAVEYAHGWDRVPGPIRSAGLARAAMLLMPSLAGSTASSWTTPDGATYSYDAAGQVTAAGTIRHYGVPRIDSVLNRSEFNHRAAVIA